MSIYQKIALKGKQESNLIKQKAEKEAEVLKYQIISEAEKQVAEIIRKAETKKKVEIAQKEAILDLELRQTVSAIKNRAIDDLFNDVLDHFKNLSGKELLNFTANLIRDEKIKGDEMMRTSRADYEKYLKALSSKPKAKVVELDLLNDLLGPKYTLSLENIPSNEEEGFLLIGQTYDLNFSIKPTLDKIRKAKEKELFTLLFEDEAK